MGVQLEPGPLLPSGLVRRRQPRSRRCRPSTRTSSLQLSPHLYTWAPLHYALSNAATCVAAADLEMMARVRRAGRGRPGRAEVFGSIADELQRTTADARAESTAGRWPSAVPIFTRACRCGRSHCGCCTVSRSACCGNGGAPAVSGDTAAARRAPPPLLLTVNAIASGLGATG